MFYVVLWLTTPFQQIFLDVIFVKVKNYQNEQGIKLQPIMAFLIPISRGIYEHVLPKLFNKAAGHENVAARSTMEIEIAVSYALYVTVRLASADESTANWILGVEFCINLWSTLQIIWRQNKVQGDLTEEEITKWKKKTKDMIRSLVIIETIEILVPLAYSVCYATAYYGPNARIMGGVKNNYWHNKEVEDIKGNLLVLFKMAGIDGGGAIIIGILFEFMGKISMLGEYCNVMKEYWITLSLYMGSNILHVRNSNIIHRKIIVEIILKTSI
jgi:hypothetical protein